MPLQYIRSPLDRAKSETPLLHLNPITSGEQIIPSSVLPGRLERVSLLNRVDYNALSYVCGDPNPVSHILMDDETQFPIAANLLDAILLIFENDTTPASISMVLCPQECRSFSQQAIWIDAVCMNQADSEEKSWQVQMTDSICSRACRTLIYLGSDVDGAGQALTLFASYGRQAMQIATMEHDDKHESGPSDFQKWSPLPLGTSRRHLIERF